MPVLHLAVVLEEGNIVGDGRHAQHEAELVVQLDRGIAEAMLDAGPFDAGGELAADLLGELGGDLVIEKGGDFFGLDREDSLPRQLLVERL